MISNRLLLVQPPTWSSLRGLGNNRLLQSTYFWIFFVPIVAKILSSVEPIVHLTIWEHTFNFTLALPFSWITFFYGALCTTLGNIIYTIRCPELVKKYDTYLDYKNAGKGPEQLKKEFIQLLTSSYKKIRHGELANNVRQFALTFCIFSSRNSENYVTLQQGLDSIHENAWNAVKVVSWLTIEENKIADAYWFSRDFADSLFPVYRALCTLFYCLGIGLFVWVSIQNILFVIMWQLS